MNICEHLMHPARLFPDRAAIVFDGQSITYQELATQSALAAAELRARGIAQGDRVALMLPNVPAFVVWYYAIQRLGAVAVSVSTRLNPQEVVFVVSDSGTKLLIAQVPAQESIAPQLLTQQPSEAPELLCVSDRGEVTSGPQTLAEYQTEQTQLVDTAPADRKPDDPAIILYTSGTTGFAKGATLSHKNVRATVHAFNHLCGMHTEDRILLAVPLFHCYGQNALLNSGFNVGATIVLQRQFDLHESKRLIRHERITKLFGVPTSFQLLVDYCEPADLDSVEYCFSAAATLPIQLGRRWHEKFGMPIYEGYGLTETAPFASYNHRLRFVPGSIGTPVDNVEMKIVDTSSGTDCPSGELGEIAIRGPNVMLGYWNRPQETAEAIRDGWFHSGDIGRMDEQGYFYIVDRVKDMISIGGMKVFPAEVERILLNHSAIREAAVVGIPDEIFGEKPVAFIVLNDQAGDPASDATLAGEFQSHCQSCLAEYKVPKRFQFVDELPRNPAGKVLKTELREAAMSKRPDQDAAAPVTAGSHESLSHREYEPGKPATQAFVEAIDAPFLQRLADVHPSLRQREIASLIQSELAAILDSDSMPGPTDRFVESGLDSIAIVELRDRLQGHFGARMELPATLVFDYPRICDLADYLAQALVPRDAAVPAPEATSRTESTAQSHAPRLQAQRERDLHSGILSMTEEEALDELLREIRD